MKRYIKNNKGKIIAFLLAITVFFISYTILINIVLNNPNLINEYLKTRKITNENAALPIVSLILLISLLISLVIFTILIIKIFIPNKKKAKDLILLDDIEFLKSLPKRIKEEIKNE